LVDCPHKNIRPIPGTPAEGRCLDCGERGFPIVDPLWDAAKVLETLRAYPDDESRREFVEFLLGYVDPATGAIRPE